MTLRFTGFRSRVILSFLGLLTLVQATALILVTLTTTQNARAQIREELTVGARVFTRLVSARGRQLAEAARLLSGDFAFKTAVASGDRATARSVLENHQARIGANVMMVVSPDGVVIADTLGGQADRGAFPFMQLIEQVEEGGFVSAIVGVRDRAYDVVVVPLLAPVPIAWIAIGFAVDDAMAQELRELTSLHVSFLKAERDGSYKVLASTLTAPMREALPGVLSARGSKADGDASLDFTSGEHVAFVTPLGASRDRAFVAVLQRSLDEALAPLHRLQLTLLALTAGALLVFLATGTVIARRVTQPILSLAEGARRIARGDYGHVLPIEQKDEIGELAGTFNEMSRGLAERDRIQVELERVGRLKRFFAPQLAEVIVSSGDERALESHRREITVVFCDLRGFTAFAEAAEPEDVMRTLREYHEAIGPLVFEYEGTLERFTGDGFMVFFNDPVPCPDPAPRAVRMAVAMRHRVDELIERWGKRGHALGFGVGIAIGYATLGKIGFEGRFDYSAIGTVTNLSSRLCAEARSGQILVSQRVYTAVRDLVKMESVGSLVLKGFARPVPVYNVVGV